MTQPGHPDGHRKERGADHPCGLHPADCPPVLVAKLTHHHRSEIRAGWDHQTSLRAELTLYIPSSMAASTMALSSSSSAVKSPEMARWISGAASSSMLLSPAWRGQEGRADVAVPHHPSHLGLGRGKHDEARSPCQVSYQGQARAHPLQAGSVLGGTASVPQLPHSFWAQAVPQKGMPGAAGQRVGLVTATGRLGLCP